MLLFQDRLIGYFCLKIVAMNSFFYFLFFKLGIQRSCMSKVGFEPKILIKLEETRFISSKCFWIVATNSLNMIVMCEYELVNN